MAKRVLAVSCLLVIVLGAGLYFWAQAIFASDTVRQAVEAQLTTALGQPVRIGGIGATVFPRVTMTLSDVRIGEPARITAQRLDVGTALGALISRRIEHGSVRLQGATVQLPLPPPTAGNTTATPSSSGSPAVEIVSVDEIVLDDVDIVSGGRTLRGTVEMSIAGRRTDIRRGDFTVDGMPISVVGRIDDSAGPRGQLTIRGTSLDILALVAFANDVSAGETRRNSASPARTTPDGVTMDLELSLETERAMLGTLALDALSGTARVSGEAVTFDPIEFGVFGGKAHGTFVLALDATPAFRLGATVSGIDLAALTKFAGHPDLLTGRFAGRLDVSGRGTTADAVVRSTTGTARIDAADGSVKGLGLVRAAVLAGSGRGSSQAQVHTASTTEPFASLGATLALAGGAATTNDLRFESKNLLLDATGSFRLDGSNVDLAGKVQLSDELTAQAGQDLVRYTAENGRVTLPASISGPADKLQVRLDTGAVLKRAIANRAHEEVKKALGGLFGR
jgi:uncharacterized protein involved in outer membrane biogenesis